VDANKRSAAAKTPFIGATTAAANSTTIPLRAEVPGTTPKNPLRKRSNAMPGRQLIDLAGKTIGKLTVLSFAQVKRTASGAGQYFWLCRCECGAEKEIDGCCLRRATTLSCGCYGRERSTKHGMADHPLYVVWCGIKARCYNANHDSYPEYGGRGIVMCDSWHDDFAAFYADMGDRPTDKHTIERADNDGPYCKSNCSWVTRADQTENLRSTRLLSHDGVTLSIGKWAKRRHISRSTIRRRLKQGATVAAALGFTQ
jgi:hypothetical protein